MVGWGISFKLINVVTEYCRSNLALREAASSPRVISVVNSLTLVFMLPVPLQPGNDGAVENGPQLEASYLCLVWTRWCKERVSLF